MATKRISREAMAQVPEVSSYDRAQDFLGQHWRTVVVAILLIVAGVAVFLLIQRSRADAEMKANGYWMRAQRSVLAQDYASALELANALEDRHGGTRAGKRGLLVRADALLGLGRQQEARDAYERARAAVVNDPILWASATRGLAVLSENTGDLTTAAALYEELAEKGEPAGGRVFDHRAAGRCYRRAGQTDRALEVLRALVVRYDVPDADDVTADQVNTAKVMIAEMTFVAS